MIFAIVPAAGRGDRLGGETKKQFLELAGIPIFIHTLALFQKASLIDEIICVVPKEDHSDAKRLIAEYSLSKVKRLITGGAERQDSVAAAVILLEKIGQAEDIVLVHDGVRPLATTSLISKIIEGVKEFGAAVAAYPVTDSLKEVSERRVIQRSLARDRIWAMQTPQGFRLSMLTKAYQKGAADRFKATDEAILVERLNIPIHCVIGASENIKITNAPDLKMAEFFLRNREVQNG